MARDNLYEITIDFDNKGSKELFKDGIEYVGSKGYRDKILITEKKIEIFAHRSSKINLDDIFYNHNNSIYIQILKSLSYYYCTTRKYSEIESIKVVRKLNSKEFKPKTLPKSDINQIVTNNFNLKYEINPKNLEFLFSESLRGKMFFSSITHLIKSNDSNSEITKFEKLWKSFNPLYRMIKIKNLNSKKKTTEKDCLIKTNLFIRTNRISFHYSIPTVINITPEKLQNLTRWRNLIREEFFKREFVEEYRDKIIRYKDYRVMSVFDKEFKIMEQFLRNKGYYNDVLLHMMRNIKSKSKEDIEVLSFIILNYLYFIRNKFFHAEKIDSEFHLMDNKNINELKWLNRIFEPFVIDLINLNDKYIDIS